MTKLEKTDESSDNVMEALIVRIVRILMTGVECASLSTPLYMNPKPAVARGLISGFNKTCAERFHLICLGENVDTDDEFLCENCC